jgi:hypothetical protein
MFWRRSDQERVEAPTEFVLPVRDEANENEFTDNVRVAIEWRGPFGSETDDEAAELGGEPLIYIITNVRAGEPTDLSEVVERVGFSKAGSINYVKGRLSDKTARAWIGAVQDFETPKIPSNESFATGDLDAQNESEFDANLALIRRIFSNLLRPSLTKILRSPAGVTPPVRIRNLWSATGPMKGTFADYCPDSITSFKNGGVRLSWDDQARFLTWTKWSRVPQTVPENSTSAGQFSPRGIAPWLVLACLLALVRLAFSAFRWPLAFWKTDFKTAVTQLDKDLAAENGRLQSLLDAANQKAKSLSVDLQLASVHAQNMESQLLTALRMIAGLREENASLKAQLTAQPSTRTPLELDSCWSREGERMVPVYRIAIKDEGFTVEPSWKDSESGWPPPFAGKMEPLKPIAGPRNLTPTEFAAAMTPYYQLGQKPEMNCRFFVDVTDETTNKDSWKSGLGMVERYFYKRLLS